MRVVGLVLGMIALAAILRVLTRPATYVMSAELLDQKACAVRILQSVEMPVSQFTPASQPPSLVERAGPAVYLKCRVAIENRTGLGLSTFQLVDRKGKVYSNSQPSVGGVQPIKLPVEAKHWVSGDLMFLVPAGTRPVRIAGEVDVCREE